MERAEQMVIVGGIAADQWGLVTAKQVAEQGVNGVRLKRLTDAGLLEHVSRGVYLVPGAGYPQHLEIKAAWLRLAPAKAAWQRESTDPDSGVVSHTSACLLHDLGDIPAGDVEITVPRRRVSRDPDVRLRIGALEPADITLIDGLPVTTAERTIVDLLRSRADAGHIGGVIADAEHRDLIALDALADRVQAFAKSYGVSPTADGRVLIDHLVAQGGARLRADDVRDVALAAYGNGAADMVRGFAIDTSALQLVIAGLPLQLPTILTPELREVLRAIAAPADAALLESFRAALAPLTAETNGHLKDAVDRMATPMAEVLRENLRHLDVPSAASMRQMLGPLAGLEETGRQSPRHALSAIPAADGPRSSPALPSAAAAADVEEAEAEDAVDRPTGARGEPPVVGP
ncbi:type IV toxin-antitoxin system AbiEi family antitoxin domain-containing protein [Kitasatospora sp. NPDC052868]|uniref:type IV toxin-antitoxin system AbiEi family antitoxin domain-containing protein n=1 Tax=Kitasatospora sp. NPDC052868 TaxID=3364060 RepID=UPI0037C94A64